MPEMTEWSRIQFVKSVELNCHGLVCVSVGCKGEGCEYAEGNDDHQCEKFFSWSSCDSCGSTLGGDRFDAIGLIETNDGFEEIEMSICMDCAMYHANGELPEYWEDGTNE